MSILSRFRTGIACGLKAIDADALNLENRIDVNPSLQGLSNNLDLYLRVKSECNFKFEVWHI